MNELIAFLVSIAAGAVNSVAGGGSFLTFPMLLLLGMPSITANATSTVALWPGTIAYIFGYRKQFVKEDQLVKFCFITLIGGLAGAFILLATPEKYFNFIVPWLLLFATMIFTFGKSGSKLMGTEQNSKPYLRYILIFIIAVYGGFFGAGMGIMILALLQYLGFTNIHRMNAYKGILGAVINGISAAVFLVAGIVDYKTALVMVIGAIIGGYFGAIIAQKISQGMVRKIVISIAWMMTFYVFYKF